MTLLQLLESWPALRQLREGDPFGLGPGFQAAFGGHGGEALTRQRKPQRAAAILQDRGHILERRAGGTRPVPRRLHGDDEEKHDVRAVLHAVGHAAGRGRPDGPYFASVP